MSSGHGHDKGAAAPFVVPALSVVIPVHNQWQLTRACIASLLKFPPSLPFEIIVVDDGSTDETPQKLQQLSAVDHRIRSVCTTPPHRFARACNAGASASRGSLLLFMNNDIECITEGWYQPLQNLLVQQPGAGIVAPLLLFPDTTVQHCGKQWSLDAEGLPVSEHCGYQQSPRHPGLVGRQSFLTVTGACILVRRSDFFRYGPFDERFENGWEDDDLCLAFRQAGLTAWVEPASVLVHHQGATLKAEAMVLERFLEQLRSKGVCLAEDDPLRAGMQEHVARQAGRFRDVWQRNRALFVAKWGRLMLQEVLAGDRDAVTARRLSLCMIVKDEEQTLGRCLASCLPVVDELVIVDTGSADRTVQIAEGFGARLFAYTWHDDFAAARNYALEQATGDWVLIMDADEVLSAQDYNVLRDTVAAASLREAFSLTTRNYTNNRSLAQLHLNQGEYPDCEQGVGWTASEKVRLFPRAVGRFSGRIHELVEPSLQSASITVRPLAVAVHHYGMLDHDKSVRKGELYLQIGLHKLAEAPENRKALYELAVQAGQTGRYELAEKLWQHLLLQEPTWALGWLNLGYVLLRLGRLQESVAASEHALQLDHGLVDAVINRALAEACLLQGETALQRAEHALKESNSHPAAMALVAVGLYRVGAADQGRQCLRALIRGGISCGLLIEELYRTMLQVGGNPDQMAVQSALSDLSSATAALTPSTSSCS